MSYTLKYRTFNQLVDEVSIDLKTFSLENMIEPHELIKVARKVNYDLGLKLYKTKEALLDISHYKTKLPADFYVFNFGFLCGEYSVKEILPGGTHIEEVPYPSYKETANSISLCDDGTVCPKCQIQATSCGCPIPTCPTTEVPDYNPLVPYGDYCVKPRVFMNCKGEAYELIQIVQTQIRTYKVLIPVKLKGGIQSVECGCPNLYVNNANEIRIDSGWVQANFPTGKLYVNYQGMLEDDDGNLLVPDHEKLNDYYEYALKKQIMENNWLGGEDFERRLQYIKGELYSAKTIAKKFIRMPEFTDLQNMWEVNRKAQYNKYYRMFEPRIC